MKWLRYIEALVLVAFLAPWTFGVCMLLYLSGSLVARPMPEPPPVTRQTLSAKRMRVPPSFILWVLA